MKALPPPPLFFSLWVSFPLTQVQLALPAWKQVSIHIVLKYKQQQFILLAEDISLDTAA